MYTVLLVLSFNQEKVTPGTALASGAIPIHLHAVVTLPIIFYKV